MDQIISIAYNTFREGIRNKILHLLVLFAFIMIMLSNALSELALAASDKVVMDIGLTAISLFGVFIAIFVGINLVYKEIDRRTIYTIISKPLSRYQIVIGKYLGLVVMLFIQLLVMSAVFTLVLLTNSGSLNPEIFIAIAMIFLELMVLTALSICFSSYSSPFMSALFTVSIFVIGHVTNDLLRFGEKSKYAFMKIIATISFYAFPNLENFNFKTRVTHNLPYQLSELSYALVYGLLWVALLLVFSVLLFQRRDFK
jgi:ABC-type transport system involved in multi-copper enzyme maturation permease subunit